MHDPSWPADPLAAVVHPDPYPWYAALARSPGLVRDERLKLWIAAHPATVREVLMHPDCRVRPVHEPVPATIAGRPAGDLFGALARMNDGERHAAPRAALQQALEQDEDIGARAATIAARFPVHDAATLNEFMFNVPVQTVASLLGCDDARLPAIARAANAFVACLSPLSTPAQLEASHEAASALLDAMRTASQQPLGLLAHVSAAQWRDEHTLLSNLAGLLTQTYEATAGLLGNCIVARLRGADGPPAVLVSKVSEQDPAIHNTRRFAAQDLDVAGATVKAGDAILLVLATGQPFGHGRHACPGAMLARQIVAQALTALGTLPYVAWHYRPSLNARIPQFQDKEAP